MPTSKNQNYLHGAAILTVAVILVKILGAIYKIPMMSIMGPKGFAHFNVAYNLYTVLLTLSTAGLPVALSKIVSEANTLKRPEQVRRTFRIALISFIVLGCLGTAVMLRYPTELALFMEDIEASRSMFALAPSVLLVCILSAFRGYTQGLSDMRPTSISQVIETAVKVFFGMAVMLFLNHRGASAPLMAAGAISGVAVGSLVACIYTGVVAARRMKSERLSCAALSEEECTASEKDGVIFRHLVRIGVPIALGSSVLGVIALINTKLILGQLQNAVGLTHDMSYELFGIYTGALPLFNLPAAIITPLTISIIPAIAGFMELKRHGDARDVIESSLRISTIIALPMAVGLSVMSAQIMFAFYGLEGQGATILAILGVASFFVCLALMTTAILQAGGRERLPMYTMLTGGALNIVLVWVLVGNPNINILGAPVGTICCYAFMAGLNLWFVVHKLPERPKLGKVFWKPLLNCAVMGFTAWLIYPAALQLLGAGPAPTQGQVRLALAAAVGVAALVYLAMTVLTRAITFEDMKLIPKGEKLAKLLHIRESRAN